MKIATSKFQSMVAKAAKGASCNKLLPITSMMAIELKDNSLTLTTTDTANTLIIKADKVEGEDLYAVVPADLFTKLIAKTHSEFTTLNLKNDVLEVKGSGTYSIPLTMDEDGVVQFPEFEFERGVSQEVQLTTVKHIIAVNKAAVSKTIDEPVYLGYYLGDNVITTDQEVICINDLQFMDGEYLMSPEMIELLALAPEEKIAAYYTDGYFLFETDGMVLHGVEHDGKDRYQVEEIMSYLDVQFPSSCKLPKLLVQSIIDRLVLFIEPYDKNGAYFTFTKDGVKITSKRTSAIEIVNYAESHNFAPFVCCIDIPMLKGQLDSIPGDVVEVHYGNTQAVKLVSGKVSSILSLLEDDNMPAPAPAQEEEKKPRSRRG